TYVHKPQGERTDDSQSRLLAPARWSRSRRRLAALKRRISSFSASVSSSSRCFLDMGASLPRSFSRALPTASFVVLATVISLKILGLELYRAMVSDNYQDAHN